MKDVLHFAHCHLSSWRSQLVLYAKIYVFSQPLTGKSFVNAVYELRKIFVKKHLSQKLENSLLLAHKLALTLLVSLS